MKLQTAHQLRTLDFDIETRKVGFFTAGKFGPDGCEPIAIACSWVGKADVRVWSLGIHDPVEMLDEWRELYDEADCVTGHYVRKFDLPILNGAMLEHGRPPLGPKLVSDTKLDLLAKAGIGASQENLSAMYEMAEGKYHMNDHRWRQANRLTPGGIEQTQRRVVADVKQHKALRGKLVEAGFLRAPRVWTP